MGQINYKPCTRDLFRNQLVGGAGVEVFTDTFRRRELGQEYGISVVVAGSAPRGKLFLQGSPDNTAANFGEPVPPAVAFEVTATGNFNAVLPDMQTAMLRLVFRDDLGNGADTTITVVLSEHDLV